MQVLFDLLTSNTLNPPTYNFSYKTLRAYALAFLLHIYKTHIIPRCEFVRKVSQKQQTTKEFFQQSFCALREEGKKTKRKTESRLILKLLEQEHGGSQLLCNQPHT